MKASLVIMAAGLGRRYGGLKQMDRLGPSGETIMEYSIFDAIHAGFSKIVFVIRRDIEQEFKAYFFGKLPDSIEVEYAFQELTDLPEGFRPPRNRQKPWGTSHALLAAASSIQEPFGVINADDFYGANAFKAVFDFLSSPNEFDKHCYCIPGYKLSETLSEYGYVARAVCETDTNGYLINISEKTHISKSSGGIIFRDESGNMVSLGGEELVSMNFMGFTPSIFFHLRFHFKKFLEKHLHDTEAESYLPDVVNGLIKTGAARVKILDVGENWFGVTYREDKVLAIKKIFSLVQKGIYPENLWE